MTTVGGWFVQSYELEPDETKTEKYATIHHRGDQRPWGGRLYLTDRRLIFVPNFIDRFLGGESFDIPLLEVDHVSTSEEDDLDTPKLVSVSLDDGTIKRFHIDQTRRAADAILDAVGEAAISASQVDDDGETT